MGYGVEGLGLWEFTGLGFWVSVWRFRFRVLVLGFSMWGLRLRVFGPGNTFLRYLARLGGFEGGSGSIVPATSFSKSAAARLLRSSQSASTWSRHSAKRLDG